MSKYEYISNLWNLSDVVIITLNHFAIIFGVISGPVYWVKTTSSFLALMLWGRTLYFGRGSTGLASLIYSLKVLVWNVRYFGLIFFLFLFSFAVAFRILGTHDSVFISFVYAVNRMLGDVSFETVEGNLFAEWLYLLFCICVAVMLLNALIAFMQSSFDKAIEVYSAAISSRLKYLAELNFKMAPLLVFCSFFGINLKKESQSGDLVVLCPESEGIPSLAPVMNNEERLTRIDVSTIQARAEISNVKFLLSEQQEIVQKRLSDTEIKLANLESKLDKVLKILSNLDHHNRQGPIDSSLNTELNSKTKHESYNYFGEDENKS